MPKVMKGSLGAAPRSRCLEPCTGIPISIPVFGGSGLRPQQNIAGCGKVQRPHLRDTMQLTGGIELPLLARAELQETKEMPPEKDNLVRLGFL